MEKSIAAEERNIADIGRQIGELKERFRNQLQQIGIEVFDGDIDSLLMPVTQDDFVSMAAVVSNISTLTAQLEGLTEKSKELPPQARRYYGMYLLLVYAIDRLQVRFIQERAIVARTCSVGPRLFVVGRGLPHVPSENRGPQGTGVCALPRVFITDSAAFS